MKGNYQHCPDPCPSTKSSDQQAEDKQPTGKNNARRTAGHALPAPARPAEEPPQNRRRRTRHAMQQILRHAIEHELDRLASND